MKMNYLRMTLLAVSVMMSGVVFAQNRHVFGKVIDEKGEAIPFVNAVLLSLPDSTIVHGTVTDEQGMFSLSTDISMGVLHLSMLGYETVSLQVEDVKGQIIRMKEDMNMLGEAVVKGFMPKTKLTGNSMITTIQGTVLGNAGTAHEMLSKVPGITQRDDELEVIGKGKPVFYLNGRKVQDKDELKSLHSNEIQNVEVITNPGALYDATISAVVRIRTVKTQGEGFGFNVNAGNDQDLVYGYSDPSTTLNMKYRHNSIDVFGMVSYAHRNNVNISQPIQTSWFVNNRQLININQDSWWLSHDVNRNLNANLGFNWQISRNHSVGVRVETRNNINPTGDYRIDNIVDFRNFADPAADYVDESVTDGYEVRDMPYYWIGNAYYNGQAGKLNIDFNMDFVTRSNGMVTDISEIGTQGESKMRHESSNTSELWATKLVLSYPVWRGQLQAGTEMSFVERTNSFAMTGYPLPSTDSDVKERNYAGFVNYAFSLEKFGNLSAGLRYEHVGFDYEDILNPDQSLTRYTDDLFPSISWSSQFGQFRTALAYSAKVARPSYDRLNENINYMNSFSLEQGNSKLKNETIYEASANIGYQWLNFFIAYERRDNTFTQGAFQYNDQGVIVIRQMNLDSPLRNIAAFLSAAPTFGCYNPNWTLGVQRYFYKQTLLDPSHPDGQRTLSAKKPVFFMDFNNAFRFKGSWQIEANLNVMTKGDMMQFAFLRNTYNLGLVVQKCWLKNDALCLRASISDVLQMRATEIFLDNGYFQLHQTSGQNYHRLNVSLRYTFNSSNNKYKGSGAGKEAQGRM
jgi:hypothetical protein